MMSLVVGDRFPDIEVTGPGGRFDLSEKWSRGALVVAYHRIWCSFCQEAAIQLSILMPKLERLGAGAVIVYQEDADVVVAICAERRTQALCVSDIDGSLERKVNPADYRGSENLFSSRLVRALPAGPNAGSAGADVHRATFVINRNGRIVYAHHAKRAAHLPVLDDLADAARRAVLESGR